MARKMLFIVVAWLAGAPLFAETILVSVYNLCGASAATINRGEHEASRLFDRVGIKVRWEDCGTRDPISGGNPRCDAAYDPYHFTVVIHKRLTKSSIPDGALGFALPLSGERNHAAVVYSRLEELAAANPGLVGSDALLGAVLAHEIAHLLSAQMGHGQGIMEANWTRAELKRIGQRALSFTEGQAEELHSGLQLRAAAAPRGWPGAEAGKIAAVRAASLPNRDTSCPGDSNPGTLQSEQALLHPVRPVVCAGAVIAGDRNPQWPWTYSVAAPMTGKR